MKERYEQLLYMLMQFWLKKKIILKVKKKIITVSIWASI